MIFARVDLKLKRKRTAGRQQYVKQLCDQEQVYGSLARFFDNARFQVLACLNSYVLTLTTDEEQLQAPKRAARARGVKLRYITDITKDNLAYCKRQMNMVDELRHLDGIRGNFILSDKELMAAPDISQAKPLTEGIHSSDGKMLNQLRCMFETLWHHSVPAEARIRELELESEDIDYGIRHEPELDPDQISEHGRKRRRKVIDRFYVCARCGSVFVYMEDSEEHKVSTGHKEMKEFPI